MVRRFWRSKVSHFDFLNKFCKTFNLRFQTSNQFGVFDFARIVEQTVDLRHENANRKNVCVAITENGLQLLDWPQSAPNSRRESGEANRLVLETLREFQHINEIFQNT